MEKKTLKVEGMSCDHCVKAITDALSVLPGVKDISVNLKGGTVSFNHDPGETALKEIETAITDAGYDITG